MLVCSSAAGQLVVLEPGPVTPVRRLPQLRLLLEQSQDFTPRLLVAETLSNEPVTAGPELFEDSPPQLETLPDSADSPPGVDAPHVQAPPGCNCPSCGGGPAQTFPGYDKLGYPLHGACPPVVISEAWCRRPWFVDIFAGSIWGDEFIDDQIGQEPSLVVGTRLGLDFDGDWGCETRFAWSEVETYNMADPSQFQQADLFLWDVSLVYYFASSLTIRPYCSVGLGLVDWEYIDLAGMPADEKVLGVPLAIGVKQRCDDWLVLRLDLTDNIAFGGSTILGTQHNFSITGNVEIRFGGSRTSYWAWAPRRHYSW
jgi:hypothetical protein